MRALNRHANAFILSKPQRLYKKIAKSSTKQEQAITNKSLMSLTHLLHLRLQLISPALLFCCVVNYHFFQSLARRHHREYQLLLVGDH